MSRGFGNWSTLMADGGKERIAQANSGRRVASAADRRCRKRKDLAAQQIRVDLGVTGGIISDLSETGISVRTANPLSLKPGERLHLTVPDELRPIQAGCELAWADSASAGMRFLVLSESSQRSIMDWLRSSGAGDQAIWTPAKSAVAAILSTAPAAAEAQAEAQSHAHSEAAPITATAAAEFQTEVQAEAAAENRAEAERRLDAALDLIAELALILTRADGVAIALARGDKKIICRASLGSAPPLGAELATDSGLTAECLRSGIGQRCQDTQADPRVDAEACRALDARSLVVYPVRAAGYVIGVLEVLSASVRNFEDSTFLCLPHLAEMVSALIAVVASAAAETHGNGAPQSTAAPSAPSEPNQARVSLDPRTICPLANG